MNPLNQPAGYCLRDSLINYSYGGAIKEAIKLPADWLNWDSLIHYCSVNKEEFKRRARIGWWAAHEGRNNRGRGMWGVCRGDGRSGGGGAPPVTTVRNHVTDSTLLNPFDSSRRKYLPKRVPAPDCHSVCIRLYKILNI